MSWFDATGFANLAKTALKEAQKTIDKALDINEEDGHSVNKTSLSTPAESTTERVEIEGVPRSESEPQLSANQKLAQTSSLWGSFSGSFFETPKTQGPETQDVDEKQPAVRPTKLEPDRIKEVDAYESGTQAAGETSIREEVLNYPPVVLRKKEPRNWNNRLSAISSGSDRRSSSSCEVLGSCTPESEPAPSLSSSSSVVRLRQSGSFESLTSPSSVEVISSEAEPVAEDSEASEASETLTSGTTVQVGGGGAAAMHKSTSSSLEVSLRDAASSCEEGTLMGSSGEENTITQQPESASSATYLKSLIADAMTEQNVPRRQRSPVSSESRSDMVKVGSSGHTSGDELETTTSSDIEIISSPTPNGSTASRHSPARCAPAVVRPRPQAHFPESEGSETEKLLKRIAEMSETLEEKDAKLIDLGRLNSELHDSNDRLKTQLQHCNQMGEDFTKRLAALECKFQQAIRDKEQLRSQLEKARASVTASEAEAEKDQTISDLRAEGEKLSKQQLTLNNLIKKLRAGERENQKVIASQREKLEECDREVERCKKALAAKQDVERTQIEAVHQLTRSNQRLEAEAASLRTHVDSLTSTIVSLQKEVAERANERTRLEAELLAAKARAEEEVRREMEAEWGDRDRSERRAAELEEALAESQRGRHADAEAWRAERTVLERRLESAVGDAERAAQSVSAATRPLMRQLESAHAAEVAARDAAERRERELAAAVADAEARLTSLAESERAERERVIAADARCSALEAKLLASQRDLIASVARAKAAEELAESLRREKSEAVERLEARVGEERNERVRLEQRLAAAEEAVAEAAERRKVSQEVKASPPPGSPSSPTPSLGRLSSIGSTLAEDAFGEPPLGYGWPDGGRGPPCTAPSLIEGLQAQLKRREGEVCQLQWEVARRDAERAALSDELARVTVDAEDRQRRLSELEGLRGEYDALLLLYGEKLEECQELRMDLQDVKDAYKAQIDQLLGNPNQPPPPPTTCAPT